MNRYQNALLICLFVTMTTSCCFSADYTVTETDDEIQIVTKELEASIRKRGYVSGVKSHSFVDKQTGARDLGFGLDIADWIMEPGTECKKQDTGERRRTPDGTRRTVTSRRNSPFCRE